MLRKLLLSTLFFFFLFITQSAFINGQGIPKSRESKPDSVLKKSPSNELPGLGVAVSPSSLRYTVKPGSSVIKTVKVSNDSKGNYKFKVSFSDYQQDQNGRPIAAPPGKYKFGLSKWVNVAPSYFELKAGESKTLSITVEVPNTEEGDVAAYCIMEIDQVTERGELDPSRAKNNSVSLGVLPSIGFGVYIYQNPPNVKNNNVEISKYSYTPKKEKKAGSLDMELINKGDGIGFCSMYIELTNVQTGVQKKLPMRQFTILPGFTRVFSFQVPDDLPKGKYSSVGVMDFGNKEHVEAAELDFTVE